MCLCEQEDDDDFDGDDDARRGVLSAHAPNNYDSCGTSGRERISYVQSAIPISCAVLLLWFVVVGSRRGSSSGSTIVE